MVLNLKTENPNEFVKNKYGVLIQRKFIRENENPDCQTDTHMLLAVEEILKNQSLMFSLIEKANQQGIDVQECVIRAVKDYLK